MHKFINSLGTIEVVRELKAIRISISGSGNMQAYAETLRMAHSFANLHHLNSYLLVKDQFEDISCDQFYGLADDWLHVLEQHFSRNALGKAKVALLVNRNSFLELSEIMHKAQQTAPQTYYHVGFDLFYTIAKAHDFLLLPKKNVHYQSL